MGRAYNGILPRIKESQRLRQTMAWMNLKGTMLSEGSQMKGGPTG